MNREFGSSKNNFCLSEYLFVISMFIPVKLLSVTRSVPWNVCGDVVVLTRMDLFVLFLSASEEDFTLKESKFC